MIGKIIPETLYCNDIVAGASFSSDKESSYQLDKSGYNQNLNQSSSSTYQQNSNLTSTSSYRQSSKVPSSSRKNKNIPVVYTDGGCFANGRRKAAAGIGVYWGDSDRR